MPSAARAGAVNREVPLVAHETLPGPYAVLRFRHPEVADAARPGQFVMIKAGRSAEPPLRRPFSVMATEPRDGTFALFVKAVGPGSSALLAMQPGDVAQCLGPLGQGFAAPPIGVEPLLVAGGYGIAPFLLLCHALTREGRRPRVFYGGRGSADLQLLDRFEALGVPVVVTTEDGSLGQRGRVTDALLAYLEAATMSRELLACGPDAMLHAVARLAEHRGLRAQVSLDPWMGCGLGTCLGCVVRTRDADSEATRWRCACTEGPVFDARSVVWPGDTPGGIERRPVPA